MKENSVILLIISSLVIKHKATGNDIHKDSSIYFFKSNPWTVHNIVHIIKSIFLSFHLFCFSFLFSGK